jgi:hypothetical protein
MKKRGRDQLANPRNLLCTFAPVPSESWIAVEVYNGCPSSKLNPRELVGGFERLAVGCLDGEADKRSAVTGPQRTSNPHRAAVGIGRPAPSNCRTPAQRNSSPLLSLLGSAVLDLVLALVAPMARQPDHRPARDGLALAP